MALGKTAYPKIGVWYDTLTGDIHLNIDGQGLSTINDNPQSVRGNPHLFRKLAKALREAGKAHPPIPDEDRKVIPKKESFVLLVGCRLKPRLDSDVGGVEHGDTRSRGVE